MSYWERRLPHWIPEQTPIFVTWRLAGTLPRPIRESRLAGDKIACPTRESRLAGDKIACPTKKLTQIKAGDKIACPTSWMDADAELDRIKSGPRWLIQPAVAEITAQALRYGEEARKYRLHAWVVMPNHVHAVITPESAFSQIMRWLKWTTAQALESTAGANRNGLLAGRVVRSLDPKRQRTR